jgi:hypothetical protein
MDAINTSNPSRLVWPALLLAPLLALGNLSLGYSLVTPSCAHQDGVGLHLVASVSLLLALAMTALAAHAWNRLVDAAGAAATGEGARATGRPAGSGPGSTATATTRSDATRRESRPPFVALVSTLTGALSCLVIAAMWLPTWLLPACT